MTNLEQPEVAAGATSETGVTPETGFTFDVPVHFHDLGMHLSDEERWAHLGELAAEIWSGGTEAQREGVQRFYAEVADSAAADGATYAGICLMATEDDRVSTASLIARSETLEGGDVELITSTLMETLSLDPACDVHRTEVEAGPAVVVFAGVEWLPGAAEEGAPAPEPLQLVRVDTYLPLPEISELLVFSLTTSSLPDLPVYVELMAQTAESVRLLGDDRPVSLPGQPDPAAERLVAAFG
ncbi:hypothetical protein ACIRBX_32955 [Kitasatospora sp. NPDC096147]|uniref:hypothetical protein n=1 Tax=Kitasatospora sp. NPDC096147 TaxID=3364093 RepID=UPI0038047517